MTVLAAAAASTTPDTVTLVTGGLLAFAAVVSSLTPILLARRRARRDAETRAAGTAEAGGALALTSWSTLNTALQQEIGRLQGVTERLQSRIDLLSDELETMRRMALDGGKNPDA